MITKTEIKFIQSLHNKKNWRIRPVFIVEGDTIITELLKENIHFETIYATQAWVDKNIHVANLVKIIDEKILLQISCLKTPNKVLAIVKKPILPPLLVKNSYWTIYLDGINDPGNLGTIIRTADWFGIKQIILSTDSANWYNPKVIQSTMGSFFRVHIYYQDLENIPNIQEVHVYGALLNGHSLYNMNITNGGILVIGNEKRGIRNTIIPYIKNAISIPKFGGAESLNAAVANGIILSHLMANKNKN